MSKLRLYILNLCKELDDISKSKFGIDAVLGKTYYVDFEFTELLKLSSSFAAFEPKGKVLLFSEEFINSKPYIKESDIRALVVHEYCHMIIDKLDPELTKRINNKEVAAHNEFFMVFWKGYEYYLGNCNDSRISFEGFAMKSNNPGLLVRAILLKYRDKGRIIKLPPTKKDYNKESIKQGLELREKLGWHTIRLDDI